MFNTHVHRHVSERVIEHVSVTENRAPTDQSVKLLREMEAAARAEVLKTVRVSNTHIEAVLHHRQDPLNCATQYAITYKVNGLRQQVDHTQHMERGGGREDALESLAGALVKALSENIARHMLAGLNRQFVESLRP